MRMICRIIGHSQGRLDTFTMTFECRRCGDLVDVKSHPSTGGGSHRRV